MAMTSENRHPLPWTITPTGDDHIVTDANGEIVYLGPDSAEVLRLYMAAVEHAQGSWPVTGELR